MTDCCFARATLANTSFKSVDFSNVDLSGARLSVTAFIDCNLSGAKGLSECIHEGPSYLDIATLIQSGRALSDAFLRQTGMPEMLIEYFPSLISQPIQLYSCFISYASADKVFADRIYADLQARGIRCWYAPEKMTIGDKIRDRIDHSIKVYDKTIVILSQHSIQSSRVENEVEAVLEKEGQLIDAEISHATKLVPIAIDNTFRTSKKAWVRTISRSRHIGDFADWQNAQAYVSALDRLQQALRRD